MIRVIASWLLVFLATALLHAQSRKGDSYDQSLKGLPLKERIVLGGGVGLSFGTAQDFFSVSPMIGYRVTERMLAGTGFTYRYTKYKYYSPSISLIDYGINPFLRYTIFNGIFVHTEYEYLNYEYPDPVSPEKTVRLGYDSFLAGGGFLQPIGDKAAFYVVILYNFSYQDVQQSQYTPYPNPLIIRGGITVGF